ncbi:MAG: hypothetical protein HN352_13225 [Bacteroidetes bacterium]|jgi:hypothetical protein|nr:hypothetical protein [Bacteroidota bacterium]MBT3748084.1 hypothetical protein [Bacteroidota bacterium]MBT4398557.1 hypothetical protein [Bacteroidota bacterium]MBT4411912.1 hypothetical protein [Bacteroidota bacterium]MBT7095583.1 hypothetical protein [Bacteroidota bacterium]
MKKIILAIFALGFTMLASAQNEQDALRLSQSFHGGSARSLSMGGAMGAFGADFGAISVNPASSAMFQQSQFGLTTGFTTTTTNALFLDQQLKDSRYSMGIDHFGFVMPIKQKESSSDGIKGLTFSFGYNKLIDYGQRIVMQGNNNHNSLVDEFVYSANLYDSWDPFTDELAWETWLIDYDSIAGVYYSDFDNSGYGQQQRRTISTKGYLGEFIFNLGANLSDRLYVGGSLGVQKYEYEETWVHSEYDPDDIIDFFDGFSFRNDLSTEGTGYNAQFGFIARPMKWIRVGGSVQSPTFFRLNDVFTSSMETDLADGEGTHEYEAAGEFDYQITTPFKAVGSIVVQAGKMGSFSLDYEYIDYSSARLRGDDYDFYDENQAVSNRYKATSNIRAGGEFVMGPLYLRAGYALYGSPYSSGEANEKSFYSSISGGLGFRTSRYMLDFAVVNTTWEQEYYLYGNTMADLSASSLRFVGSLSFRF